MTGIRTIIVNGTSELEHSLPVRPLIGDAPLEIGIQLCSFARSGIEDELEMRRERQLL
jgi:hypothetical protein